jgi:hypothetical protein
VEERRLLLLSALLLPLRQLTYKIKNKQAPATGFIIRESIKWRTKDVDNVALLHAQVQTSRNSSFMRSLRQAMLAANARRMCARKSVPSMPACNFHQSTALHLPRPNGAPFEALGTVDAGCAVLRGVCRCRSSRQCTRSLQVQVGTSAELGPGWASCVEGNSVTAECCVLTVRTCTSPLQLVPTQPSRLVAANS